VARRNRLADGSRRENDAEHMWHAAMAALLLAEHAEEPVDPVRVALLLLVHDVVEIDAGDTFLYDEAAQRTKAEREQEAAGRLFGMLPEDQGSVLRELWEEFDAGQSGEARMAASIDRLLPLLLNRASGGITWAEHGVTAGQVEQANKAVAAGSVVLWRVARAVIESSVARGFLERPASGREAGRGGGDG
jgi:putative hydrolase of HD superfamily